MSFVIVLKFKLHYSEQWNFKVPGTFFSFQGEVHIFSDWHKKIIHLVRTQNFPKN